MKAKSIKGTSPEQISTALQESLQDGFRPTLATVFMSKTQDIDGTCRVLDEAGIAIFGATTSGEFIDEELEKNSTAVLLMDMKPAHFFLQFEELDGEGDREITQSMAEAGLEKFSKPAFLIAGSHLLTDAEMLLKGFEEAAGREVDVFGAMAGDDFTNTEQFVFTNGRKSNRGIVSLVLDQEKVRIAGRATSAWKAVGTEKVVTRSEGNRVYTIEGVPALDITAKYGGIKDLRPDNGELVIEIATSCALQLQREHGDPVMRPGLQIVWEDHSFICSGTVPQGSKIRFSLPPDLDVIDTVIAKAREMKEQEMPEADALILFSCLGRLFSLGPLISEEIKGIREIWEAPMVGFFSNAELGRATGGGLEMHNLTCINVAIKEVD